MSLAFLKRDKGLLSGLNIVMILFILQGLLWESVCVYIYMCVCLYIY